MIFDFFFDEIIPRLGDHHVGRYKNQGRTRVYTGIRTGEGSNPQRFDKEVEATYNTTTPRAQQNVELFMNTQNSESRRVNSCYNAPPGPAAPLLAFTFN